MNEIAQGSAGNGKRSNQEAGTMENKYGHYYLTIAKKEKYRAISNKLAAQALANGVKPLRVEFMKSRVNSELICEHWGKALEILLYFPQNYVI